jgi:uncharacterized protein
MEISNQSYRFGCLSGLLLAIALIFSTIVVTKTWMRVANAESVTVTGSARKNIRADLIIWTGNFSSESSTLVLAQKGLKTALAQVETFLKNKGIQDYIVSPVGIQELHADPHGGDAQRTTGYRLMQSVEIRSSDVDRTSKLGSESMELVEQGVAFVANSPRFIYTKAGEAKIEMLAEAMKDARARADQITSQGGRKIHQLRSAKMGVFQITPVFTTATSWEGENDTSSIDKTVTATVTASFLLK